MFIGKSVINYVKNGNAMEELNIVSHLMILVTIQWSIIFNFFTNSMKFFIQLKKKFQKKTFEIGKDSEKKFVQTRKEK